MHNKQPFTLAVDLTGGDVVERIDCLRQVPSWNDFSMGRVREVTTPDLPTSGHIVSHNSEELRCALQDHDTEQIVMLDDTSFSGATSLLAERQFRQAFPDRELNFTHGFLIMNGGRLGSRPGARQRLEDTGSRAISGLEMLTPRDDGWHFFDIVKQGQLSDHLVAAVGLARVLAEPGGHEHGVLAMADEHTRQLLFPEMFTRDELLARRRLGHFVSSKALNGDMHVHNPQPLPNIIAQGHLLPPDQWRHGETDTLDQLVQLNDLLQGGTAHA